MVPDSELTSDSIREHLPKTFKKSGLISNKVNYVKLIENLIDDSDLPETNLYDFIINRIDKPLIESVLIKNKGDLRISCKKLGIDENSLRKKIAALKIDSSIIKDS